MSTATNTTALHAGATYSACGRTCRVFGCKISKCCNLGAYGTVTRPTCTSLACRPAPDPHCVLCPRGKYGPSTAYTANTDSDDSLLFPVYGCGQDCPLGSTSVDGSAAASDCTCAAHLCPRTPLPKGEMCAQFCAHLQAAPSENATHTPKDILNFGPGGEVFFWPGEEALLKGGLWSVSRTRGPRTRGSNALGAQGRHVQSIQVDDLCTLVAFLFSLFLLFLSLGSCARQ